MGAGRTKLYFLKCVLCAMACACVALEKDVTFNVEAGERTCYYEKGLAGRLMEAQYQVVDGRHGLLDITFTMLDPNGTLLVSHHKRKRDSFIHEVNKTGDYAFCFDNTFSRYNAKTVFFYLSVDSDASEDDDEATVEAEGQEVLEWTGHTADGKEYFIEVKKIAATMTRILKRVVKARHQLDIYAADKSRDHHVAFEDTFVVDVWSAFQISVMLVVGMVQVYMVKQLFNRPLDNITSFM